MPQNVFFASLFWSTWAAHALRAGCSALNMPSVWLF
jgi:hypothetical protein